MVARRTLAGERISGYARGMRNATLAIDGMTCGGCVMSVKRVLERLPGVTALQVDVGEARLTADEALAPEATLRATIERAGFTVEEIDWSPA